MDAARNTLYGSLLQALRQRLDQVRRLLDLRGVIYFALQL